MLTPTEHYLRQAAVALAAAATAPRTEAELARELTRRFDVGLTFAFDLATFALARVRQRKAREQ